jgi:hypothetical protein
VADLISLITGTWDEQLVNATFSESGTQLILNIPLRADVDDFIAWHFDNKGMFSVKEAYKLQVHLGEIEQCRSIK